MSRPVRLAVTIGGSKRFDGLRQLDVGEAAAHRHRLLSRQNPPQPAQPRSELISIGPFFVLIIHTLAFIFTDAISRRIFSLPVVRPLRWTTVYAGAESEGNARSVNS